MSLVGYLVITVEPLGMIICLSWFDIKCIDLSTRTYHDFFPLKNFGFALNTVVMAFSLK